MNKIHNIRHNLYNDQSGMASILITMVTMVVLGLIILGFGQIAIREQRDSLDRELSTQAFYAAESGANDAASIIRAAISNDGPDSILSKTNCATGTGLGDGYSISPILSAQGVAITCLLVNTNLYTDRFSSISPEQSKSIQVTSSNNDNITQILLSWQDSSMPAPSTFDCSPDNARSFPTDQAWGSGVPFTSCGAGVLRLDVVPSTNVSSDFTVFFHPSSGATIPSPFVVTDNGASAQGQIVPIFCQLTDGSNQAQPYSCNAIVDVSSLATNTLYLRAEMIYGTQSLSVAAITSAGQSFDSVSSVSTVKDDEVEVDSTAVANGVLRRVQEIIGDNEIDSSVYPDQAIQTTTSLCKQFYYIPAGSPGFSASSGTANEAGSGACSLNE